MCVCAVSDYSEQCLYVVQQGLPAASTGVNNPRGIKTTHSHMSPESVRLIHRHRSVTYCTGFNLEKRDVAVICEIRILFSLCSPMNLQGSIRQLSSSLSSHTSCEAGGNLVILTDGLLGEHPEDTAHMEVGGMNTHTQTHAGFVCFEDM